MSTAPSVKGGLRTLCLAVLGLLLATFVGLPVAELASGLAFVAFAMGALCLTAGLKDAAKAFLGPALLLVALALAAPMLRHLLFGATPDPQLRAYAVAGLALIILAGVVLLFAKVFGHPAQKGAPVRPTVRRRTAVTDPEPLPATPSRIARQASPSMAQAEEGDDDLGLFGGGRHARH